MEELGRIFLDKITRVKKGDNCAKPNRDYLPKIDSIVFWALSWTNIDLGFF